MIRFISLAATVLLSACASSKMEAKTCPATNAEMANIPGLSPVVWDNARATFLRFPGNQPIPAITAERQDGTERAINSNINPADGVVTVHGVFPTLILRDGNRVACVRNLAFDQVGR